MDVIHWYLGQIREFLNLSLFALGTSIITIGTLVYVLVLFLLLLFVTGKTKRWVVRRLTARGNVEVGTLEALGTITSYLVIFLGVLIILQSTGIDLSGLAILAGAFGIGIGFGLQNITTNFISGLIILFERPIKVGDRIELETTAGDVTRISLRATTIVTNDNIAVIVPNSEFVSGRVINWSYTDRNVRFHVPVGVSYASDPEMVKKALLEVADEHPGVLKDPEPDVMFKEFGDSSLNFALRVWTNQYTSRPIVLHSELNFAISKKLKDYGIEIPFPQRDLHLRSGSIRIQESEMKVGK